MTAGTGSWGQPRGPITDRPAGPPAPPANPDRACEHPDFAARVDVNRLTHGDNDPNVIAFAAEIHIACAACGERFRFIGASAGMMPDRPTCSIDEYELRVPIRPATSDPDFGLGIPGYAVRYRERGTPS